MIPYSMEYLKRKVVIYARVSTEHEAQISALENQLDWYKPLLDFHPEWTLVERYVDEGITGTSAEKRPEFMRMIGNFRFPVCKIHVYHLLHIMIPQTAKECHKKFFGETATFSFARLYTG